MHALDRFVLDWDGRLALDAFGDGSAGTWHD
jgi:hypothetical protein